MRHGGGSQPERLTRKTTINRNPNDTTASSSFKPWENQQKKKIMKIVETRSRIEQRWIVQPPQASVIEPTLGRLSFPQLTQQE